MHHPEVAKLKDYALAVENDIDKVLKFSNILDKIVILKPELQALCVIIAKYLNVLAHEYHTRQARELIELAMASASDMQSIAAYDGQLATVRIAEAQYYAEKIRARSAIEGFA